MNNAFRTILLILTAAVTIMGGLLGCKEAADGTAVCSASWLTPQLAGYAVMAFTVLGAILKAARPGGWLAGLFGQTAVVTENGVPGTVTLASVKAAGK